MRLLRYKVLMVLFFMLVATYALADSWKTSLTKHLGQKGALLVQDPQGNTVFAHNQDKRLIPASILKIATADAVITQLGKDYRISTEFFLTPDHYLGIKGFGDPTLVSESLDDIAQQLTKYKISTFKGFWLDTSYFKSNLSVHGQSKTNNPYDSSIGALVANYNTVYINKSRTGKITSAEVQTPLTPTAIKMAEKLAPGKHRINIGQDHKQTLQYFSELLQAFLKKQNIAIPLNIIHAPLPEHSQPLLVYQSPAVTEIIKKLFFFSNNLIANHMMIILAAETYDPPADLDMGKAVLVSFLMEKIGIKHFVLEEGSGLSRKNQITAREMMKLLIHFNHHKELLKLDKDHFLAKTGTLKRVSNYAGYMISPSGESYPFVIMLNDARNSRERYVVANLLYQGLFTK